MSEHVAYRSELKQAQQTEGVLVKTHIGGQALIEGIMMRGRYNWAVAVRQPDGTIYTEQHDLASGRKKNSWMYLPVVRGCTAMVESLMLGYKALNVSTEHAYDFSEEEAEDAARKAEKEEKKRLKAEERRRRRAERSGQIYDDPAEARAVEAATGVSAACDEPVSETDAVQDVVAGAPVEQEQVADAGQDASDEVASSEALPDAPASEDDRGLIEEAVEEKDSGLGVMMTVSMIVGMVLGIVLFIVAPAFITNLIMGDYGEHTMAWNIVDGVLRMAIFIFYIWAIGRMKDIKRMFSYHGAEHKTIHCFEHGLPLTPENAQQFPTLHVRCGTAFMVLTMLIAIFVYTIIPVNWLLDSLALVNEAARLGIVILSRIVLLPLVAGLAYEVTVKWAGSHPDKLAVRAVLWPGMQMQRLTTNQPDDGMLECAIAAMNLVLEREKAELEAQGAPLDAALAAAELPEDRADGERAAIEGEKAAAVPGTFGSSIATASPAATSLPLVTGSLPLGAARPFLNGR